MAVRHCVLALFVCLQWYKNIEFSLSLTSLNEMGGPSLPGGAVSHIKRKEGSRKDYPDLDEDESNKDDVVYVKGEPIITTGSDVSRFLVDVRDDGDPALTFHSLFIGTVCACLGATLCQVRLFVTHGITILFIWFIIDLPFQTTSSFCISRISSAICLQCRVSLVEDSPSARISGEDLICKAWSCT